MRWGFKPVTGLVCRTAWNKSINNPSTRDSFFTPEAAVYWWVYSDHKHEMLLQTQEMCWIYLDGQQRRQAGGGLSETAWPRLSAVSHQPSSAPQKLDKQVNPLWTEASPFCQVSGKGGKHQQPPAKYQSEQVRGLPPANHRFLDVLCFGDLTYLILLRFKNTAGSKIWSFYYVIKPLAATEAHWLRKLTYLQGYVLIV